MHTEIDAAHDALRTIPARISVAGTKNKGTTALYRDVPVDALPAGSKVTPTQFGFTIEGSVNGCHFRGEATRGDDPLKFQRVILSFVAGPTELVH